MSGIPFGSGPGSISWRDEDGHKRSPIYSGMEAERGVFIGDRLVSVCEAARIAAGVDESESVLFGMGWLAAANGRPPGTWTGEDDPAWLHGWNAYPNAKWEDPYAGMNEQRAEYMKTQEQDEVTRKIKRKTKRGAQMVRPQTRVPANKEG